MNLEFIENVMKARKYGEAAVKSLVPADLKRHMDVIENEMTDMAIEYLEKRRKRFTSEDGNKDAKTTQSTVKKVTIE